jgi:hypothetical protein
MAGFVEPRARCSCVRIAGEDSRSLSLDEMASWGLLVARTMFVRMTAFGGVSVPALNLAHLWTVLVKRWRTKQW